jgi:antiviral helicase SKI2
VANVNDGCSGNLSEAETVTLETEVDTTEASNKASENAISLDDILSGDSEGPKLHLEGFSDEVGQKKKLVSGYATMLS